MTKLWTVGFGLWAFYSGSTPRAPGKAHSPKPTAISIAAFKFAPAEVTVSVGDTIAWTNDDDFAHTTAADSGAWTSAELRRGQRFAFVPSRAGRYAYHCAAHPVMQGVLVVRE